MTKKQPTINASPLASVFTVAGGVTINNRLAKSATSEQLGDKFRNPKPGLGRLYQTWSDGGAGLLITGNIMVDRTALGEPFNVVLDAESDLDAFRSWASKGTANGNQLWAQLNHPGKQSPKFLSPEPAAPSAVPLEGNLAAAFATPRALTEPEIERLIRDFALAAGLAKQTGFTGVQIHGAHGYLVSQFLSPKHNRRQDRWGGSLESRMRFVLEVYRAIRGEVGEGYPVAIKLNSADFQRGGFTESESMQVVEALASAGVDLIEISGGTYERPTMMDGKGQRAVKASTRDREAYFLAYASELRKRTDVPLMVTGGFRSAHGMAQAIDSGATDLIGLARPLILNPTLPRQAMESNDYRFSWKEPTTGFPALDSATMLPLIWYEKQMWRIAAGRSPQLKLSPWLAAVSSIWKILTKPPAVRRG